MLVQHARFDDLGVRVCVMEDNFCALEVRSAHGIVFFVSASFSESLRTSVPSDRFLLPIHFFQLFNGIEVLFVISYNICVSHPFRRLRL